MNLIYSPEDHETYIFNTLDLSKVSEPLYIEREEPIQQEECSYDKKKSEVIEYENEEYTALLEQEQEPFLVTDSESKQMCGKFQNMNENSGMYFAFINNGISLRVVPISKWYKFVQRNQIIEGIDIEGLEKNLNGADLETHQSESEHEIDFEINFSDDDEEENKVLFEKEKKLSSSGKKLQGLVRELEEDKGAEEKEEKGQMKRGKRSQRIKRWKKIPKK